MAFKNIFSSAYAIVENVSYNGSRKSLTFDLVLYRDSNKLQETGRMQYQVDGNMTTFEIESVITAIPAGLDGEALPEDFDFDALATFKPYLVGNNPTAEEFTEAGSGELKTGFQYLCEIGPQKQTNEAGEEVWGGTLTGENEQLDNPDYDSNEANEFLAAGEVIEVEGEDDIVGAADGSTDNPNFTPEFIEGEQISIPNKIKYDWGCICRDMDFVFVDKAGDYWEVTGNLGGGNTQVVSQLDAPFLASDWDTWFSATAMDKLNKNISERIYTWLKAKPEYKNAVSI